MFPKHYSVALPVFSGPMDLLLHLIEREELDITRVALAQVTDQYLAYVRQLEKHEIADLAEFLLIAARLLLIKSEALLPRPPVRQPEELDPAEELARQLREYKRFKDASVFLLECQQAGRQTFVRMAKPPKVEPRLDLSKLSPADLMRAMLRVLLQPRTDQQAVTSVLPRPRFLVRDKIAHIARILGSVLSTKFFNLLHAGQPRAEVVATFLAVLELVRRHMVHASQPEPFGDIDIERAPGWQADKVSGLESELDDGGLPALQPAS